MCSTDYKPAFCAAWSESGPRRGCSRRNNGSSFTADRVSQARKFWPVRELPRASTGPAQPTAGQLLEIEISRRLALEADLVRAAERHDLVSNDADAIGHQPSGVALPNPTNWRPITRGELGVGAIRNTCG